jgi:egghead protein (zeste-white 4 protein)
VTVPTVIFQVTAIGKNVHALDATVESVRYWVRRTPYLRFRYLIWVVAEPEGYATDPSVYEKWRSEGVDVYIVPKEYETPQRTRGKGRALQYACDLRRAQGLSNDGVWLYHQDEETCVGQDTLLGISEFVNDGSKLLGTGIILYPIHWTPIPTHVQEFTRSYDDLRVLDSLTLPGNPTVGFHGSHFVVRADAEDDVGWDLPGYAPAEDLAFEIRLRNRYGSIFGILRGFAYEKGAFSLGDQLRQRRRWVRGIMYAVGSAPGLSAKRRATLVYSAATWFSALPSVAVLLASIFLHYGPLLYFTSFFTGFVWVSMITGYVEGARIHSAYLDRTPGIVTLGLLGIMGALIDLLAPWYALFTQSGTKDFVLKDPVPASPSFRETPAPRARPSLASMRAVGPRSRS